MKCMYARYRFIPKAVLQVFYQALYLVTFLTIILFSSACGAELVEEDISAATQAGIIIAPGSRVIRPPTYNLVRVTRGNIYRDTSVSATAEFATIYDVAFTKYGGVYSGPFVETIGQRVRAGDVLGEQIFLPHTTEPMDIARYRQAFALEQFEARFASQRAEHRQAQDAIRQEMAAATGRQRELLSLQLARQELLYERFLRVSAETRQNYLERIEELTAHRVELHAPIDGLIMSVGRTVPGTTLTEGQVLFTIACEDSFRFRISASPEMLGYGQTISITRYELSFEVDVVSDPMAAYGRSDGLPFILMPACDEAFHATLEEHELTLFDVTMMMRLRIELERPEVYNALLLPTRVIRSENNEYYVLIYNDGLVVRRFVTLGFQTRAYVEILMGVEEGQQVVIP